MSTWSTPPSPPISGLQRSSMSGRRPSRRSSCSRAAKGRLLAGQGLEAGGDRRVVRDRAVLVAVAHRLDPREAAGRRLRLQATDVGRKDRRDQRVDAGLRLRGPAYRLELADLRVQLRGVGEGFGAERAERRGTGGGAGELAGDGVAGAYDTPVGESRLLH